MKDIQPLVLVVDDEVCIRRSLARLFRALGLELQGYASAHEFLARERLDRPACLVLDLYLREMNGLELLRRLAETEPDLPVVVVTGHTGEDLREQTLAAGAAAFLTKPFEAEDLLEAIRLAVARHS
jgi:FixJ family two-component response regulator